MSLGVNTRRRQLGDRVNGENFEYESSPGKNNIKYDVWHELKDNQTCSVGSHYATISSSATASASDTFVSASNSFFSAASSAALTVFSVSKSENL